MAQPHPAMLGMGVAGGAGHGLQDNAVGGDLHRCREHAEVAVSFHRHHHPVAALAERGGLGLQRRYQAEVVQRRRSQAVDQAADAGDGTLGLIA